MDYKELLKKYIEYVGGCEGINFIDELDQRHISDVKFTDEEWKELNNLI